MVMVHPSQLIRECSAWPIRGSAVATMVESTEAMNSAIAQMKKMNLLLGSGSTSLHSSACFRRSASDGTLASDGAAGTCVRSRTPCGADDARSLGALEGSVGRDSGTQL